MRDELVSAGDEYKAAAEAHLRASEAGDATRASAEHDRLVVARQRLRAFGRAGNEVLLDFLKATDPGVRSWAATHALEFAPAEGEQALVELADGDDLAAFNAGITLQEWRAGRLRFA